MKVLVSDNLAREGLDILEAAEGITADYRPGLSKEELLEIIGDYTALVVRSGTKVTAEVIEAAGKLRAIARAGVGVDNIDVAAASKRGIIVMNTPGGNTISTAEHTMALILALCRNIAPAANSLKEHRWDRKKYKGTEVRGKRIAVIGLGRIGKEVVKRSKAFEMKVVGYDPFFGPRVADELDVEYAETVEDAVRGADIVTVHTPVNDQTRGMINAERIALMADGARVINCARGGIVDEKAVNDAIESGKLSGAAFDVYPTEPPEDFTIIDNEKVLATPHLGASTTEAQITVAVDACSQIVDCLTGREIRFAVNMPITDWIGAKEIAPYGELGARLGQIAAEMAPGKISELQLVYGGEVAEKDVSTITTCAMLGALSSKTDENVNLVSAAVLARESGIKVTETKADPLQSFTSTVTVRLTTEHAVRSVSGTLFGPDIMRLIELDGIDLEVAPEEDILFIFDEDRPGLIAGVTKALGDAGVNIARMAFGRERVGGRSVLALNLDAPAPEEALKAIDTGDGRKVYRVAVTIKKALPIS